MVAAFAQEHDLEAAEMRIELVDGSRHVVATTTPDPGFGFFSFTPYDPEDGPRCVIVPIGAVRSIEISVPDPEQPFGFVSTES